MLNFDVNCTKTVQVHKPPIWRMTAVDELLRTINQTLIGRIYTLPSNAP